MQYIEPILLGSFLCLIIKLLIMILFNQKIFIEINFNYIIIANVIDFNKC